MSTAPDSEAIVELLRSGSTYPERVGPIQTVETHISWVFLTDRHAYKLKKPVRFEFLDFSTAELRRRACLEELRLNRRLAPDVYLAVLPITAGADRSLELGGSGQPVDWVVQMRRLPAEKAVDQVLQRGELASEDRRAVAQHLVGFYARLPAKPIAAEAYRHSIDQHVRANGEALLAALSVTDRAQIRRIVGAQLRYLHVQAEAFDDRVRAGRIVEGHGDLRPEHIYLERPPAVIDCIEFSEDLRTLDIADELSFLAMECESLGDGGLGEYLLAAYQSASDDAIPERLQAFYRGYRACVRAKVAALRAQQEIEERQPRERGRISFSTGNDGPMAEVPSRKRNPTPLAQQYLDLADRYTAKLGPPSLLIVGGLMGTGKSTLARQFAESFGAEWIATDHVRREMLGASPSPAAYGEGIYLPEQRQRVYDELFRRAEKCLAEGRSVILDGTFLTRALRERAVRLADERGGTALNVLCQCPRETSLARIDQRAKQGAAASEARNDLYDKQAAEYEPPGTEEPVVTVDATQPLALGQQAVYLELQHRLFG